jgi:hypothetical protein
MNKAIVALLGAFLSVYSGHCFSHGDWPPVHGGLISDAGEITYELVDIGKSLRIYVSDHGKPTPAAGSEGTLTVIRDRKEIWSTGLTGSRDHLSALKKPVLKSGDQVVVKVSWPDGSSTVGRFSAAGNAKPPAQ